MTPCVFKQPALINSEMFRLFQKCFSDDEKKLISKCFKEITVLKDFGDVPIDETQLLIDMTGKTSSAQGTLENQ